MALRGNRVKQPGEYSLRGAADYLGRDFRTVQRLCKLGKLLHRVQYGAIRRRVYIHRDELDAFLERERVEYLGVARGIQQVQQTDDG